MYEIYDNLFSKASKELPIAYNMFEPMLIHNTYSDATNYNFK